MSKKLSWSTIQSRMLDAYLFQMPTNSPITFGPEPGKTSELVGDAQNFVIILLDGPIVGGQAGRWGLTQAREKQLPTNLPTNKDELPTNTGDGGPELVGNPADKGWQGG